MPPTLGTSTYGGHRNGRNTKGLPMCIPLKGVYTWNLKLFLEFYVGKDRVLEQIFHRRHGHEVNVNIRAIWQFFEQTWLPTGMRDGGSATACYPVNATVLFGTFRAIVDVFAKDKRKIGNKSPDTFGGIGIQVSETLGNEWRWKWSLPECIQASSQN